MAVFEIWDIKGRLDHPINYAKNEMKTNANFYSDEEINGLQDILSYASNKLKTTAQDKQLFVTGLNCNPKNARKAMSAVKEQFADKKEIVAFHAFQSFVQGEVSPKVAHEVGVKLAEKMWSDRFQVIVATHLNTHCVHNHFVINSTSFIDGKRFYDNKKNLYLTRQESDKLCKEYSLSVIENPRKKSLPHNLYQMEKQGKPTRYNLIKSAIDEAISHSSRKEDFFKNLTMAGYKFDFRDEHKYATITPIGYKKAIRVHQLGENYSNEQIFKRIEGNSMAVKFLPFQPAIKYINGRNIINKSFLILHRKGGLSSLFLHYCYRLGILPKGTVRNNSRLHYIFKDDLLKIDKLTDETILLYRNKITNKDELESYKSKICDEMTKEKVERQRLWNLTRSIKDTNELSFIKQKVSVCSSHLKDLRKEVRLCDDIELRSDQIKEKLDFVVDEEKQNRKEKSKDEQRR